MAKYWTPGRVKTRLGAAIGDAAAAELHRCFVAHLCGALARTGDRRQLVLAPPERLPEAPRRWNACWQLVPQHEGDLGDRMRGWFRDQLAGPAPRKAVLIGGDCPLLGPQDIEQAFSKLAGDELVLGPAVDGGYYLIGLRGPWDERFDSLFKGIPWSTDAVLQTTRHRAARNGFGVSLLGVREDVDTEADLRRLRDRLRSLEAERGGPEPSLETLRQSVDEALVAGATGGPSGGTRQAAGRSSEPGDRSVASPDQSG